MKAFVELLNADGEKPCGSDSVFILDGRNSFHVWKVDARTRLDKMRKIHPRLAGYRIMLGNLRSAQEIYRRML
jgi:hypothetical protein